MTDDERSKILQMIEDGKISTQQGLELLEALKHDDEVEDEASAAPPFEEPHPGYGANPDPAPDPEISRLKSKVRSLYAIPLFVGVLLTIGMSWLMYQNVVNSPLGFAFYCLWMPLFLFGVALIALAASSRKSPWIYVDVRPKDKEGPKRIMLGFPLSIVSFILNTIPQVIPNKEREKVRMAMDAINDTTADSPIVVNVDEGEDGDRVKVYIG
jgi:hypothetical protein